MIDVAHWFRRCFQAPKSNRRARLVRCRFRPGVESVEERCVPTTYTVTSLGDAGPGTLRDAIIQANTNHTGTPASPDVINFTTGGGTISVGSTTGTPLPGLAANEVAILDATTASGYSGTPVIVLDGISADLGSDGLTISGGSSTIKGFDIIHFSASGIELDTNGGDTVVGNYIGIKTGSAAAGNGADGIFINGPSNNTIGGSTAGVRNVISGNSANGVLIASGSQSNIVAGNYIGTDPTGANPVGNGEDGIEVLDANNNVIGNLNPASSVSYFNPNNVSVPVAAWQGLRGGDTANTYLISGSGNSVGVLYNGTIDGNNGQALTFSYPNTTTTTTDTTSAYGPNNLGAGMVQVVGSYKNTDFQTAPVTVNGFIYQGPDTSAGLANASNYATIDFPGAKYNYVHSVMGGLAVGNYDNPLDHGQFGLPLGPGHAFLYDVSNPANPKYITDITFPGSVSNTAYGIWYNGGTSYTIVGGWSPNAVNNFADQDQPFGSAYIVDYDSSTGTFSHFTSLNYPFGSDFLTHFEGISSVQKGVYTMSADSLEVGATNVRQGSWVTINRNSDGSFGPATWVNLNYPGANPGLTSSNSVFGNQVVGLVFTTPTPFAFQATVNVNRQLSNVISGNGDNGIELIGANNNQIAMNYVGTDVTGTAALGNQGNGILVTAASQGNTIGGVVVGGNNPSGSEGAVTPVFVPPTQGNVISANAGNGVLIMGKSTQNQLSGNFIGTDQTGDAALGNHLDGVDIDNADGNSLLGCTFTQDPFVYYNVISANENHGLQITDSNNTTAQADFFGIGANNSTDLGNRSNGVLIEGSSANTQFGGAIPLGNVVSWNGVNGIFIRDTANGTVVFNTFGGTPAFQDVTAGNGVEGILITSTGGNNLIRTNIFSANGANGIHISGNATGVQVTESVAGLSIEGDSVAVNGASLGNGANGVLIDGNAHDNFIGGEKPSVAPENVFSNNGGAGIFIGGNATHTVVTNSRVGTNIDGTAADGNAGAGIFVGGAAQGTIIGGTGPAAMNVISANFGDGIEIGGKSQGTRVLGNLLGMDETGTVALGNKSFGIAISNSGNQIGGTAAGAGNTVAFNHAGIAVLGGATGNTILSNSLFGNEFSGILLTPGSNNNQPAPILTSATQLNSGKVQITGSIAAAANTTYTIQIFKNSNTVVLTAPEGQTLLGTITATTDANGVASFVFQTTLPAGSPTAFTATVTPPNNNTSMFSVPINLASLSIIAVGADTGGTPVVNVYNSASGQFMYSFLAYPANFTGGVRVAVADVTGTGVPDIITGPGPGGGADIRVFNGSNGQQIASAIGNFLAFAPGFTGGVYVAGGDVNGDGMADIIVGAGAGGGPVVSVFSGANGAVLTSFMAYDPSFTGGVTVAAGNVGGTGLAEVVTGPGAGGGPVVSVFNGTNGTPLQTFFALDPSFTGGLYVTVGDVNSDGRSDIIVGAGAGGGPYVFIFNSVNDSLLGTILAFPSDFTGGVRVGAYINAGTGQAAIVTGAGPGGAPLVNTFDGASLAQLDSFFAFDPTFSGGVYVAAA